MEIAIWIIIGLSAVYGIYRLVRIAKTGLGTIKRIASQIEAGDAEAQQTPKSLSAVDSIVLPNILRDFPEFDRHLMQRRAEKDAMTYLESLTGRKNLFTVKDGIRSFLEEMDREVVARNHVLNWNSIRIHRAALSKYENQSNYCYVTYQVAYQYENSGRIWQKKLEIRYLAADEPDIEKKISVYNCPNCGAPIGSIGQKKCQYCGTVINPSAILSWYIFGINLLA